MFWSVLYGCYLHQAFILVFFTLLYSDPYNKVPALDPEKLKIFNTVREITGGLKCVCVLIFNISVCSLV